MALGKVFENNQNLIPLIRPVLRELALKTGESATFYIRQGQERVVLAREEGTNAIRFTVQVGQRMDLYAGAAGKVLLAYLNDAERDILLARIQLTKLTTSTISNVKALVAELKEVRQKGYAISKGRGTQMPLPLRCPFLKPKTTFLGRFPLPGQ